MIAILSLLLYNYHSPRKNYGIINVCMCYTPKLFQKKKKKGYRSKSWKHKLPFHQH